MTQEEFEARISQAYGEQCADTDGLAVMTVVPPLVIPSDKLEDVALMYLESEVAKLTSRAEQAERNLETAIRERDALRAELNQRMAIPARALRFGI